MNTSMKAARPMPIADSTALPAEMAWERAVLAELRAIRVCLEQRSVSPLTRTDRTKLAAMLPAIAGALGSEPFASRDLVADDAAPALRLVFQGLTVKSIGRLLARAEGVPIGGFLVERCGVEINVTLWRVVAY